MVLKSFTVKEGQLFNYLFIYLFVFTIKIIKIACHYGNTPIQIYRKFHLQKLKIFG